ncbi:MAG: hypothetical protein [Microviridae sp.]|nr:MAG: hypothetical protein [Microviridae sp.]
MIRRTLSRSAVPCPIPPWRSVPVSAGSGLSSVPPAVPPAAPLALSLSLPACLLRLRSGLLRLPVRTSVPDSGSLPPSAVSGSRIPCIPTSPCSAAVSSQPPVCCSHTGVPSVPVPICSAVPPFLWRISCSFQPVPPGTSGSSCSGISRPSVPSPHLSLTLQPVLSVPTLFRFFSAFL